VSEGTGHRAQGTGFFRSRWVEAPSHVRELEPSALPAGFRAAGVAAGLGPDERLDVGVLFSGVPETVSAARFTSNARVGAPVIASREADTHRLRAVVANAVCSNVGDGQRGLDTARATQVLAAELLGIEPAQVGVASTGVIGTELPREPLLSGVRAAVGQLGEDADKFSQSILTSDRAPKRACLEVELSGGTVRLSAQVKGAGMISPRFATMFCFVQTDAAMSAETIELLTGVTVKRSFDRVSVDGQLSTSDTVFALANGASAVTVEPQTGDELRFGEAMDALLRQLALDMVADGEGAKRVGRIVVRGAHDVVEPVARAVANSPLVKTALHGADPNFGRILQAAGMAYPSGNGFIADLEIEGQLVVSAGDAVVDDLRALDPLVQGSEVEYSLTLPGEGGETEVFFSDLSAEYVQFNSEYTS
jgi:glutamate N-acetyltransferase / amino-acid N-acetyltransferase